MQLRQIFKRFLIDNGIYPYFIRTAVKNGIISKNALNDEDKFVRTYCFFSPSINDLPYRLLGSLPIYCGDSNSPQRRKFYRINRKWKDLVKNIRVQHNLKIGDEIELPTVFIRRRRRYFVTEIRNDGLVMLNEQTTDKCYKVSTRIQKIRGIINSDKKFFINYYITNEKETYGKVNGDFDEVQLQRCDG